MSNTPRTFDFEELVACLVKTKRSLISFYIEVKKYRMSDLRVLS